MILQALTQLFEDLVERGEIDRPGWSKAKISFALCLDEEGNLTQVIPQQQEELRKNKQILVPLRMRLPSEVKRTVDVRPNFLWDNSSYLLGIDGKGKPERSLICFQKSREHHHQLLDGVSTPQARAILRFFDTWRPEQAEHRPALADCLEDIRKGGNLVFRPCGMFPQNDKKIAEAWDAHYEHTEGEKSQCLVTGKLDVIETVHPSIKGVQGAQSSGAAVVSFNAPAFCSYGKEQSMNAPVGKYAAFAYTAALNYLLADKKNVHMIGDTTVVCWAKGAEPEYNLYSNVFLFGDALPEALTTGELHSCIEKLSRGLPCHQIPLDMGREFYILGLAPNAARLSVRFFYTGSFGQLMKNVALHYSRMEITGLNNELMSLDRILKQTINENIKEQKPSPVMSGAVARAVFTGGMYPAALLENTILRIRAEKRFSPGRAAIMKAYYLRNKNSLCPEEVLTVSLNENSTNIPYTLGRIFAVYEVVQEVANPGINTTIMDKYFNSASATPAMIFPILDNLCQKHLRKLQPKRACYYDKLISSLKSILSESYPGRLSLPEQGSFNIGYYHQKAACYTKKEEQ